MIFLFSKWMQLPLSTRIKIASQFGFTKTGPTHVSDNRIISDGYKIEDVEKALNADAIHKFIGVEHTDSATMWDLLIAKIEEPIIEEVLIVPVEVHEAAKEAPSVLADPKEGYKKTEVIKIPPRKKRGGRPKGSKNKK